MTSTKGLSLDDGKFQSWLRAKAGLSQKSARDVVSRLRRVARYVDVPDRSSYDEMAYKLSANPQYKRSSVFVRSQLKRAVRLLSDFRRV